MTSTEETTTSTSEAEIQQIPPLVSVADAPSVTDARDTLLKAIAAEAQHVADKHPGQASKTLAELAHAYALVTAPRIHLGHNQVSQSISMQSQFTIER